MKVIKFGGTAFQNPKLVDNVCEIIKKEEKPLLVVVSAIGRKGFPFATETLINSLKENNLSKKEYDRLLSLGEIYSSIFLTSALKSNKINAYSLSYLEIGIECNDNYSEGHILSINDENIQKIAKKYEVLVVPGFVGSTSEKEVITLGRGTSDLTAVELSRLLKNKEVTLYKDVDGIYPTMFTNLYRLKPYENLSYDEVLSLIKIGFSPVNKKAILEAKKDNLEIIITNFIRSDKKTLISSVPSKNRVIGFNIDNNKVMVSTLYPEEIKKELIDLFKYQHIYIKDDEEGNDYFSFKVSGSQLMLVRQIIVKRYFVHMF